MQALRLPTAAAASAFRRTMATTASRPASSAVTTTPPSSPGPAVPLGGVSGTTPPLSSLSSTDRMPLAAMTDAHRKRTPMIMPSFWTGTPTLASDAYTLDASTFDLPGLLLHDDGTVNKDAQMPAALVADMEDRFYRHGLVLVRNTGLADHVTAMGRVVAVIAKNSMDEYKGGANARAAVEGNVFETGAPPEAHLHYHHEMAYVTKTTKMLGFCCHRAINDGLRGASFLSDAVATTDALMATELGQQLRRVGLTFIRVLTDATTQASDDPSDDNTHVYNHWQKSFGVDTVEEVERLALSRGLEFEWGPRRLLKTKFHVPAFEYFPQLDRNILYGNASDDSIWFDTWPGVRKLPTMESFETATEGHRPLKATFGDGSEFSREDLELYVGVHDRFGLPLVWREGDVAVFCNHRWAHGRPSYHLDEGESRVLGVVLGDMFERLGPREDKW